jgi:hypothetical protein
MNGLFVSKILKLCALAPWREKSSGFGEELSPAKAQRRQGKNEIKNRIISPNFAAWRLGGIKSESEKSILPQRRKNAKVRRIK